MVNVPVPHVVVAMRPTEVGVRQYVGVDARPVTASWDVVAVVKKVFVEDTVPVAVTFVAERVVPVAAVKYRFVVVAVVMVAVEKERFTYKVRSAERSPPPKRPFPALMVREDETMVNPNESVGVPVAELAKMPPLPVSD